MRDIPHSSRNSTTNLISENISEYQKNITIGLFTRIRGQTVIYISESPQMNKKQNWLIY